ncbi:MAG: methyltransferase domain-containing protein [Acetobacteraceae bacterium]
MQVVQATADPQALIDRVADLIDAGRTGAARPLLAAVHRMTGPSATLSHLAARLALRDGTFEQVRDDLDAAIVQAPEHAGLRKCRSEVRHRMGDLEGATRDAAEAVILDRDDPVAKALLGTLMLELGRPMDAAACLREAVAQRPADAAFREALALAQERCGDTDLALHTLEEAIALAPAALSLRNAAVMLCMRRRDFNGAVRLAEQARSVGIADACLFGLMGHALSSLGRHDDASDAYQEALKLGPDDPYVRHLVSTTGAVPQGRRAPEAYVRAVFDGYADRFEGHLISLGYRIPGVMRRVVLDHPALGAEGHIGPVLDLGCGTGLVGLALGDLPLGPITGVDASPGMLAHAHRKGLYAELIEADLMTMLARESRRWPLIIAADVMCYFGALDEVFAAVHARLAPFGWFVLSLETLVPDHDGVVPGNGNWALMRQGRYAHAPDYVCRVARQAGLRICLQAPEVIRFEGGVPVDGSLLVLERAGNDA